MDRQINDYETEPFIVVEGGRGQDDGGGDSGGVDLPKVKKKKTAAKVGESRRDFLFIKIVARITLQILRRFWAFSSAAFIAVFVFYWLWGGFIAFGLLTLSCAGLLYHAGDRLLYHPDQPSNARTYVISPSLFGLTFESLYIRSVDGTRLHAFLIKCPDAGGAPAAGCPSSSLPGQKQQRQLDHQQQQQHQDHHQQQQQQDNETQQRHQSSAAPTVLFLHGNAGNIGHRLLNAKAMVHYLKCNVFLLEYRGYGQSDGTPCEEGLYMDAQAGLDHLSSRQDIDPFKVIVFGRSLGGAVAAELCSRPQNREKVAALMLENSFTSIPDIARKLFNVRPVRSIPNWFYKNQFLSHRKLGGVAAPVLFLSGLADNLVPPSMMKELFQVCGSQKKYLARFPGGTHNETWTCPSYHETIIYFLEEVVRIQGSFSNRPPPPTILRMHDPV